MKISFRKLIIHNFLSYGHAEITLQDKKYCRVSGINLNPKDNARSNGSGKSSWGSAICWALTGETINSLTSGIKNVNIDEDLCYVTLEFIIDCDSYIITRYKNPKSDLRIECNGVDISGKGIRESEQILTSRIPDLTSQLIGSIIILGQGLPCKFTANTPSGRKDVLEKLSKSDFMIQDLKDRIAKRQFDLNNQLREKEDNLLAASAKKSVLSTSKQTLEEELQAASIPKDFDAIITNLSSKIEKIESDIADHTQKVQELSLKNVDLNKKYTQILTDKNTVTLEENNAFNEFKNQFVEKKTIINSEITTLSKRISEAKKVTDICPTCGQKIPNIILIDTSGDESHLNNLREQLTSISKIYDANEQEHKKSLSDIDKSYNEDISQISFDIKKIKDQIDLYSMDIKLKNSDLISSNDELSKIKSEKENYLKTIESLKNKLYDVSIGLEKLDNDILYNNNEKQVISTHLFVINQLNSLIKRDFRGYLLTNVINFIEQKAQEYCKDIFNTRELIFRLDGNNIDIQYCGKAFENLSGGEKQRIDLIIQFAIRDMMHQYLGFSSNILILDEIFDSLDAVGCTNILNLISNKLTDIESIFIISHRADELEIPYDSELIVIKDVNGVSRIK